MNNSNHLVLPLYSRHKAQSSGTLMNLSKSYADIPIHAHAHMTPRRHAHTLVNTHTYIKRINSIDFFHVYLKVTSKLLIINSDHSLLEIETNIRCPELRVNFQGS